MSAQERSQRNYDSPQEDEPIEPAPSASDSAQTRDSEVDALLDEIDDVLETNAESFVRGFVQKGGQ